jgi:glycosyltransferase involved in cell wall biosynthesis
MHSDIATTTKPANVAPGAPTGRRILVISPTKDEEAYLGRTIHSVAAQTVRPTLWIIVDDGSSDRTGSIADAAAAEYSWIRVIHRPGGTVRRVGPGVIDALYAGLATADLDDFDYVCKLDGDLEFESRYFEACLERFETDPTLGTVSGKTSIPVGDGWVRERTGDDFSHGVAKLYRRECFQQIGGFVREVMWDGIDCHRCRMLGWKARSIDTPELAIKHLRQMGSSHKSVYHGRRRWGRGQYFMGTHPLYLLGIAGYRMAERPWVLGGLNILIGYLGAALRREPRYTDADPEFRRFLHAWQLDELQRRLLGRAAGDQTDPSSPRTADH